MRSYKPVINPITGEIIPPVKFWMETDTIIVYRLQESELKVITEIADNIKAKIYYADYYTDLIAIPSFYIIMNPLDLTEEQVNTLFNYWQETKDIRVLFTYLINNDLVTKVPKVVLIDNNTFTNPTSLKMQLLQRKTIINKKFQTVKRYDTKVLRIILILKRLRQNRYVYTKDLALEFNVSARTIQRDIQLLEIVGEAISYDDQKKAYYLMTGKSLLLDYVGSGLK